MEQWMFTFFTYAFAGWCVEVVYAYSKRGEWINRGFLNGPVCPIYGIGMILLSAVHISLFKNATPYAAGPGGLVLHLTAVFLMVTLVATGLELITGVALERLFATKWWDYSTRRYNLRGFICMKFSLL